MIKLARLIIILICISALTASLAIADIINQENLKTHLRWNLTVPRDQFFIVKKDQTLFIETVNLEMFESMSAEVAKMKLNSQYIDGVNY